MTFTDWLTIAELGLPLVLIMMSIDDSEMEDFRAAIQEFGLSVDDFNLMLVEESFLRAASGLSPIRGVLQITHHLSGNEKQYECGNGTNWPNRFRNDLAAGAFLNELSTEVLCKIKLYMYRFWINLWVAVATFSKIEFG